MIDDISHDSNAYHVLRTLPCTFHQPLMIMKLMRKSLLILSTLTNDKTEPPVSWFPFLYHDKILLKKTTTWEVGGKRRGEEREGEENRREQED